MFADYITIVLTIITIINSALGLLILFSSQSQSSNKIYSLITVTTLLWIWSMIFYRISSQEEILFWTKILYISATFIASSFLFFTYLFPTKNKFDLVKQLTIVVPNVAIVALILFTDLIIKDAQAVTLGENTITFGKYYFLYVIYILAFFNIAFSRLIKKYRDLTETSQKRQVAFFFTGYFISALIAFTTNLILPWFGYYSLNWLGQASTVLIVTFATYAIVKHQLFNVKAVAAELFIGSLWVFILIRIIFATTNEERLLSIGLLLATIFTGVSLIKSIVDEVKARREIEGLAQELEKTNIRLRELDQQKSEFVSLASHQLRGPLTAVKGYASMLLEGDFGEVKDGVKDAMEKIYTSTQDLVVLVNDYLDVSRIEQGRMQYDFTKFDIQQLVATIITELQPNVDLAGNKLTFDFEMNKNYTVNGDQGKIKQVISNLLDNSNKYTPKGQIHVWVRNTGDGKIQISISDNGVGIHADVLPQLFEKFTRAPDASKTNIMGTGLGLYVAKKMIEAHHGRVWAESAGVGKGSTFFIEIGEFKQ